MLLGVAKREQARSSQSLSVVWAEGGQQRTLEEALGIGEFDYPALVVLSQKKQVRCLYLFDYTISVEGSIIVPFQDMMFTAAVWTDATR